MKIISLFKLFNQREKGYAYQQCNAVIPKILLVIQISDLFISVRYVKISMGRTSLI